MWIKIKMKKNKGFIGLGVIVAIILGIIVVGGGAYYLGSKNNSNQGVNNQANYLPTDQNQNNYQPINTTNNQNQPIINSQPVNTNTTVTTTTTKVTTNSDCTPATTPWIKVLSPNGGETYTAGQKITVKWSSCKAIAPISIILIKHDSSLPYNQSEGQGDYAGFNLGGFNPNTGVSNTGSLQVTLPSISNANLTPGQHYFISIAGQDDSSIGSGFNARDYSDNLFTIN